MAEAGLKRLNLTKYIKNVFPTDYITPPAGQGALAIITRKDSDKKHAISKLNDYISMQEVLAEKKVLEELMKVPYGSTTTYKELAEKTGNPKAVRAVGSAMRTNPIIIVIPCHRVLQTGGGLGNYSAGGPANKDWLLTFENQNTYGLWGLF